MATAPPEVKVHPGNVTFMVADWGNERSDRALASGQADNFGRLIGGFLISANERTEMIPGIASDWGISNDGLTWSFTVRRGVKFLYGTDLKPKDVLWSLEHSYGPQAFNYSKLMDKIELTAPDVVSATFKQIDTGWPGYLSEAGAG